MSFGNASALTNFWSALVDSQPADFKKLLGCRSTETHHYDKVADHGGEIQTTYCYLLFYCIHKLLLCTSMLSRSQGVGTVTCWWWISVARCCFSG